LRFINALILICLFLLVTSLQSFAALAAPIGPTCVHNLSDWTEVAPSPTVHLEGTVAIVAGKLFVISGFTDSALTPTSVIDVYDPATDTWEPTGLRGPAPIFASHIQGAVDGQFIWIAGGFVGPDPGVATDEVWRYDTVNDIWEGSVGANPPIPALPEPRASGALVRVDRTLHYISGLADRNNDQPDHWTLDLDNPTQWLDAPGGGIPNPRNHFQAVVIDGVIYAGGGQFNHDTNPTDIDLLDIFDTASNTWTTGAVLPHARSHAEPGTFVLDDRLVLVGGRNNQDSQATLPSIVEYDPQTNLWRTLRPLPDSLIGPVATVIGNHIIVTDGGTAYNQGQIRTWISEVTVSCPPPPVTRANSVITDISISGALNGNVAGFIGDQITWVVTVSNFGTTVAQGILITEELDPQLRVDSIQIDGGTATVNGHQIMLMIPSLNPGQSINITLTTTIMSRTLSNIISSTATLQNTGKSVSASVQVLPPVTTLPATGESPAYIAAIIAFIVGIGCLAGLKGIGISLKRHVW
jgi:uncharacterized repeat protein (TIGR01451 family)